MADCKFFIVRLKNIMRYKRKGAIDARKMWKHKQTNKQTNKQRQKEMQKDFTFEEIAEGL